MKTDLPSRRLALRLVSAATLAGSLGPLATAAQGAVHKGKLAILSMVGHDVSIVEHTVQIGSRMPPRREAMPVASGMLDQRATLALDKAARAFVPAESIVLMSAQGKMWSELQRDAMAGDAGMKDMVATVTDVARQGGCNHALVLMKHRGVAKLRLHDTSVGHGMLEGLGYYIDTSIRTTVVGTQEEGIGILAPFAYMKLLYIDANSVSLAASDVSEGSRTYAPEMGDMRNPWESFSAEKKTRYLVSLMETQIEGLVQKVLNAA